MARKTKEVTITTEGRDRGKTFIITEMPASRAEKWAARALLAITRSGVPMPEELRGAGMAAIAIVGIRAILSLSFEDAEPLLDEMMTCVQIKMPAITRPIIEDGTEGEDIEEPETRLLLRSETLELHTGFSVAALASRLAAATQEEIFEATQMSPNPSEPSSPPGTQPLPN
jgi:hypothetical protein